MARAKSEPKKRSSKSRPSYSAKQTPHGKAQVYMQNENNKHRASRALEPHTYRPGVHAPQQQAQQAQQHAQRAARKQQQQQQAAPRARKPHRYRPGEKALREIRHYQRSTELLIPHVKFGNLAMELFHTAKKSYKIQVATLSALQVNMFSITNKYTQFK